MEENKQEEEWGTFDALSIFTLLVRCPRCGTPNASCPFAQFRDGNSLEEKFRIAESLSKHKGREMLAFHNHCLARNYAETAPDALYE